ncbi:MAG: hypothetical protein RLZZ15_85 [Verrucomicrobiota bacterium]
MAASIAAAEPRLALGDGESLTYRVGWGLLTGAGEIKIAAAAVPPSAADATARLQVTTTTATKGFTHAFYTFEARAEALFDVKTGRLVSGTETSKAPKKETKTSIEFDYAKSVATYANLLNPAKNLTLPLPPGDPLDLIMSLVQTRTWDLKPGEKRDALVLFDDEFYELTLHAIGYEDVKTPLGKFKTLVLEPRMEKTPAKGMFKRGSTARVWISQDEKKLPVKFQVEFKFGAGVATLVAHTPPISPASPSLPTTTREKTGSDAPNPRP